MPRPRSMPALRCVRALANPIADQPIPIDAFAPFGPVRSFDWTSTGALVFLSDLDGVTDDRLYAIVPPFFDDDFESGNTVAWSVTRP